MDLCCLHPVVLLLFGLRVPVFVRSTVVSLAESADGSVCACGCPLFKKLY